jgi:hypothetical protein
MYVMYPFVVTICRDLNFNIFLKLWKFSSLSKELGIMYPLQPLRCYPSSLLFWRELCRYSNDDNIAMHWRFEFLICLCNRYCLLLFVNIIRELCFIILHKFIYKFIYIYIYITAIGLKPGGSHLHTNSTQKTQNRRYITITKLNMHKNNN